jgi:ribosome-associated protein
MPGAAVKKGHDTLATPALSRAKRKPASKPATKPAAKIAPAAAKRGSAKETLRLVLSLLGDMKAENSVTVDLTEKPSIGDYMVVTTGRSNVHVAAIADNLVKGLKAAKYNGLHIEGLRQGDWVLIDVGNVVVHVFRPEVRDFYNLEKMWSA